VKWFTREWAQGALPDEDSGNVPRLYATHLDAIDPRLDEGTRKLARDINIHDGRVKRWCEDASTIELEVLTGDLPLGYQRLTILFEDASLLTHNSLGELHFDDPRTELLYDEIDLSPDGLFDYRVLLSPKGDFAIRFASVTITSAPATPSER
jgi:hypothetical protein